MGSVLETTIILLIFIAVMGTAINSFYNEEYANDNMTFSYDDNFTSTNTGFFDELTTKLDNIITGLSDIPYISYIVGFVIGGTVIILILVYLRGI